uniref:Solute carrier family 17 member 9 n=1 Tax=Oryctolagus cuniculus TaxID=9986 RepID=A0A5F9DP73_RABIT
MPASQPAHAGGRGQSLRNKPGRNNPWPGKARHSPGRPESARGLGTPEAAVSAGQDLQGRRAASPGAPAAWVTRCPACTATPRCSSLCRLQHRRGEGHLAVGLRLGLPHGRHPAAQPSRQRPPGLHNLLARPHGPAARGLLPRPDQPVGPEGAGERAGLHLQHRGLWLPARDTGNWGRGLPAAGLVRLAECLLLLRRPHLALGGLRVQVPAEWKRLRGPGRPSRSQAVPSALETALPKAFSVGSGPLPALLGLLLLHPPLLAAHLLPGDLPPLQGYRTITVRKFMQVMGLGLSSIFALCVGHSSSFLKSVVFASASIGLQTFNHSGISVNIQDLAPSCAGFLFGVANTAGALAGVVGVYLSGYLIETTGSWTSLFHLVAAISNLGLCSFLVFGQAQRVDLSPTHEAL